jgi:hypothetical protein
LSEEAMQYSPKLAFWSHYVQAQERYWSVNEFGARLYHEREFLSSPIKSIESSIDEIPAYAHKKFVEAGTQLSAGNVAKALTLSFQALEICSFTLGLNHPAVGMLMHHIASICESQGLQLEALRMRRTALEIFAADPYASIENCAYFQ